MRDLLLGMALTPVEAERKYDRKDPRGLIG
jgi:hypothetical protein